MAIPASCAAWIIVASSRAVISLPSMVNFFAIASSYLLAQACGAALLGRRTQRRPQTDHGQVDQRNRDQILPAHTHELIDAQTWQRPTYPHHDKDKKQGLGEKPKRSGNDVGHKGDGNQAVKSSEKHHHHQRAGDKHIGVLGQEKERETKPTVLRMIAGDEFESPPRRVKGRRVVPRQPSKKKYPGSDKAKRKTTPENPIPNPARLRQANLPRTQRSRHDHTGQE